MNIDKYLKERLSVTENWDKYDRMTHRYSFEDMQEIATDLVEKLTIPVVIVSVFCECEGVQELHAMTGEHKRCGY